MVIASIIFLIALVSSFTVGYLKGYDDGYKSILNKVKNILNN